MKLVTKFFLTILTIIFFNIIVFYYFVEISKERYKSQTHKEFIDSSHKFFSNIEFMERRTTHSIASILANNQKVIDAYLNNDRQTIIEQTQNIWENLSYKSNLVYEIHYFKPGGYSFVNFSNLQHFGQDVSHARADVLSTFASNAPSEHFWICKMYPGTRSTHPIIHDGKTIGVISIGLHLVNYSSMFLETLKTKNILIYDQAILTKRLKPKVYDEFVKDKISYKDWIIDTKHAKEYEGIIKQINLQNKNQRLVLGNKELMSTAITLTDKEDIANAHLLLIKDYNLDEIEGYLIEIISFIIALEVLLLLLFGYFIVRKDTKRITDLIEFQNHIASNDFHMLETFKRQDNKNEFSILENNTYEMGKKFSNIFKDLSYDVEKFKFESEHDTLTGLLNRRSLESIGEKIIDSSHFNSVSILMIDIDHFKKINDTYGHKAGDIVLQKLANILENIFRKNDYIFRYGGEEFCVIMHSISQKDAYKVAQKIRKEIQDTPISLSNNITINITMSGGIATYNKTLNTLQDIITTADNLLYNAKISGRNKISI